MRKEAINQNLPTKDIENYDVKSEPSTSDKFMRRSRRESKRKKMIGCVCNIESFDDKTTFNDGDLARCSEVKAFNKFEHSMNIGLKDQENEYYARDFYALYFI